MKRLLLGIGLAGITHPVMAQAYWYYCEPARAYYPYVNSCSTPWRAVAPTSDPYGLNGQQQPSPRAASPTPASTDPVPLMPKPAAMEAAPPTSPSQQSEAFKRGQNDRSDWETWFGGLTGDYRAGAEYWAAHRSSPHPGSCSSARSPNTTDWIAGCLAAQQRLAPFDEQRRSQPDYRVGWNNPVSGSVQTALNAADGVAQSHTQTTTGATETASSISPVAPSASLQSSGVGERSAAPLSTASTSSSTFSASSTQVMAKPSEAPPTDRNWLTILLAALGAAVGVASLIAYFAKERKERALRVVRAEINQHAEILHVKRRQTVLPDIYGTVFVDKWQQEKKYYILTRIIPALSARGMGSSFGEIAPVVDQLIEEAAQRPITPVLTLTSRFISNPEVYDPRMHPIDYERHCALLLEKAGWSTLVTTATGDQGADVIARRAGKVLVLQCKLYTSPVGNDAVQQVIAARQFQSAHLAAVASNQPFTRSARQLASISDVHLLHHDQLISFVG